MDNKPDLSSALKDQGNLPPVSEEANSKKSRATTYSNSSEESLNKSHNDDIVDDDSGYIPEGKFKNISETIADKGTDVKKILDKRGTVVLDVSERKSLSPEKRMTLKLDKQKTLQLEKKNSVFEIKPTPVKDDDVQILPGKLSKKLLTASEFNLKRSELGHIEFILFQTYRFYMIILTLAMIFAIGSALGIIIVSLIPPFDVALIPLSIYMGFLSVILSIIVSAKKRHNINNHYFAWRFLLYCIAGNLIVLVYLVYKVVALYPDDNTRSTGLFVFASGYLILFLLIEIILLFYLYPESRKIQTQMETRESLIDELYLNLASI